MRKKKEKWVLLRNGADYDALSREFKLDPVVLRVARNRGLQTKEEFRSFFYPSLSDLNDPRLLKDSVKAAEIISEKIKDKKRIRIIGDYDIDGVCSTYILYDALKSLGAVVDFALPDRVADGYGLNERLVRAAFDDGCDTILTCDNGIAAAAEISLAKELGMTVVVTDHHEVPIKWEGDKSTPVMPPADAIVDPKRPDCEYPFPGICGAVVAWKVITILFEIMGLPSDSYEKYLEFAAFATIGDVMELKGENRTITYFGLKQLNETKNPGMQALIDATGLSNGNIKCYQIGFVLGPCVNATGRLDTAERALTLFLSHNSDEAGKIAKILKDMNDSRKALTEAGTEAAENAIASDGLENDAVLVIYLPDCHESLAGIIAGRIRERYYRPVIVLTKSENGAKGSGRSIPEYNMFEGLSKISDIFTAFGGHPMAAGLSLPVERVEEFRRRVNEGCELDLSTLEEKISIDVDLPLDYVSESLIDDTRALEPCGNGNERPLFAQSGITPLKIDRIGKAGNMLRLTIPLTTGRKMTAVCFSDADEFLDYYSKKCGEEEVKKALRGLPCALKMSIIFTPQVNEFRGEKILQVVINNYC